MIRIHTPEVVRKYVAKPMNTKLIHFLGTKLKKKKGRKRTISRAAMGAKFLLKV
jgi:hypothetical protein